MGSGGLPFPPTSSQSPCLVLSTQDNLSHWCVQVVACQEQIQSRMASLKARMEQPIEGFAQAVAVMNQDLQNVKRSIAQQQQQRQEQEQSDRCVGPQA